MICLDKADESAFKHLAWNQSPPALAADDTTCQDLNGISNLREHVQAGQDGPGGGSLLDPASQNAQVQGQPPGLCPSLQAGRWSKGLSSRLVTVVSGDDLHRLSKVSSSGCSQLWGWTTWLLSVAFASFLLNLVPQFISVFTSTPEPHVTPAPVGQPIQPFVSPVQISKRSTCQAAGAEQGDYNTPLHIGAVLIVWFVSTSAAAFPILAAKVPGMRIPPTFFFVVRHFGTGVLIATAFVHLLPTAFGSLGDPCLGDFWTTDYPAIPGAIALAAIFFVTVIEMIFHPARHDPPPSVQGDVDNADPENNMRVSMPDMRPPLGRTMSIGHGLAQLDRVRSEQIEAAQRDEQPQEKPAFNSAASDTSSQLTRTLEQQQRKERLQCVLLEMGILFHSVFIGMALSVSIGNSFIILLIAIIFHQMFEGLALGARISAITWTKKTKQPWLMAFAYGLTTPIGQAIGLATHQLYSPNSEIGLIVVGVMNAVSAGLLTFASLVELLSEDFLSDDSWLYLRGKRRIIACLLVFFGAFLMSLVGAWA